MKGKTIGYIRVSSADQNIARQLDGIELDKTFIDMLSGKDTSRPQFEAMMEFIREGDILMVHSMDRLCRNLKDLLTTVEDLTKRGVEVHFLKEGLKFTGDANPMSMLMLSIMGAVAAFERALIRERQREGIAIAKAEGAYKGRPFLKPEKIEAAKQFIALGLTKAESARRAGIGRTALYRYLSG